MLSFRLALPLARLRSVAAPLLLVALIAAALLAGCAAALSAVAAS